MSRHHPFYPVRENESPTTTTWSWTSSSTVWLCARLPDSTFPVCPVHAKARSTADGWADSTMGTDGANLMGSPGAPLLLQQLLVPTPDSSRCQRPQRRRSWQAGFLSGASLRVLGCLSNGSKMTPMLVCAGSSVYTAYVRVCTYLADSDRYV